MEYEDKDDKFVKFEGGAKPNHTSLNKQGKKGWIGTQQDYIDMGKTIDNPFILRGYRCQFNSWFDILKTLFIIHNETVNIWTHMLGCILFIVLLLAFLCTWPNQW